MSAGSASPEVWRVVLIEGEGQKADANDPPSWVELSCSLSLAGARSGRRGHVGEGRRHRSQ